ncbi:hypothetical protein Nepgr_015132 [Nepenthes gracilis]|uniref:NAC domain-containing protein n=1 Tax=Nepenthes gracilis TaxID=150966 RepID=A0AAD3XR12_NEPGR|nr:hypothetical protein Nepgr_015132 [Nepenthes gracilis]
MGRSVSAASLAPGFRFHPTDEELVSYYLKRKVCGKPFRFQAISEIDIYKFEPWDLPGRSLLKSRDLEWAVHHKCQLVGMKKTLVYHCGRAPRGKRTNWVMHEYRLVDDQLERAEIPQDAFVLCRIFQKSGAGPKNGEQYGAPFVEEEWEDDDVMAVVPGGLAADEVYVGGDAFVECDYLDQNNAEFPSEVAPPLLNFYHEDCSNHVEDSRELTGNEQTQLIGGIENQHGEDVTDGQKFFDLHVESDINTNSVNNEYVSANYIPAMQSTDSVTDAPFYAVQPCLDGVDVPFDDGLFLEANDLLEPIGVNPSEFDMLQQCLTFFDAEDDIEQYLAFDPSELMGTDAPLSNDAYLNKENLDGTEQVPSASQKLQEADGSLKIDGASSSEQAIEVSKSKPDMQCLFSKQASRMIGDIPAPPAFASEFPTKDLVARLNAAAQSSTSVHLTTQMIRMRNTAPSGNAMQWSLDKHGNVNVVVSFDLPEGVAGRAGKMASAVSGARFCFFNVLGFVFAVSVKIGICIWAK